MYIVLEGIVWSGKSTQAKLLVEYVQSIYTDKKVHYIREPGSTPIAEGIRHIAQGTVHTEEMHPLTHAYLYAAARAQTLHTVVYPLLAQGDIVVSDRSYISSLAYQGYAQGLGIDTVYGLNTYALGDILPDILLHIDTPIDIALPRTYDQAGDTWESMWKEFFEQVHAGYMQALDMPHIRSRVVHIDGTGSIADVHTRIVDILHTI